jgi:hypothetical protein
VCHGKGGMARDLGGIYDCRLGRTGLYGFYGWGAAGFWERILGNYGLRRFELGRVGVSVPGFSIGGRWEFCESFAKMGAGFRETSFGCMPVHADWAFVVHCLSLPPPFDVPNVPFSIY